MLHTNCDTDMRGKGLYADLLSLDVRSLRTPGPLKMKVFRSFKKFGINNTSIHFINSENLNLANEIFQIVATGDGNYVVCQSPIH